jgi:hypothetical protein
MAHIKHMNDHDRAWYFTIWSWAGSAGTWVFSHHAIVLSTGCALAGLIAAIAATRASLAYRRFLKLQTATLLCEQCINGNPPDECPHMDGNLLPKLCPKRRKETP